MPAVAFAWPLPRGLYRSGNMGAGQDCLVPTPAARPRQLPSFLESDSICTPVVASGGDRTIVCIGATPVAGVGWPFRPAYQLFLASRVPRCHNGQGTLPASSEAFFGSVVGLPGWLESDRSRPLRGPRAPCLEAVAYGLLVFQAAS